MTSTGEGEHDNDVFVSPKRSKEIKHARLRFLTISLLDSFLLRDADREIRDTIQFMFGSLKREFTQSVHPFTAPCLSKLPLLSRLHA